MSSSTRTAVEISDAARAVLARAWVDGERVFLPAEQLARDLYDEVNTVLTRLGGKWKGGKTKAHLFDHDPTDDLNVVRQTGLMPPDNPFAFYSTPPAVVTLMLEHLNASLEFTQGMRFLEPSAGRGAIAVALRDFVCLPGCTYQVCEIQPAFAAYLRSRDFEVVADDFLAYQPEVPYDAILMNPPFRVDGDSVAYATHIRHAYELLAPGGVLVAIAPAGFATSTSRFVARLREWVMAGGYSEPLPADSFKPSGTAVNTVVMVLTKPTLAIPAQTAAAEEYIIRAVHDEYRPPAELDHAYELTRAIGQAVEARERKANVPVFGDVEWIALARQQRPRKERNP